METSNLSIESKHRNTYLLALSLYIPVIGIASAIGFLLIYLLTNSWQMIVVSVASLLGSGLFLSTRQLVKRNRNFTSAILMMLVTVIQVSIIEAFWSGATLGLTIVAWVIILAIAWFGIERNFRLIVAPIIGVIASLVILFVNSNVLLPRLDITNSQILKWLIPLLIILFGVLSFLILIRGITTRRLADRMMPAFLLIVLIPILTLSTSSIFNAQENDRNSAISSLENAITYREGEVNRWISDLQGNLSSASKDTQTLNDMLALLNSSSQDGRTSAHLQTITNFYTILSRDNLFQEIFLMSNDGTIVADTDASVEGQNAKGLEFFQLGISKLTASLSLPTWQPTGRISVFISLPIIDPDPTRHGQVIGVLAGRANMHNLDQILIPSEGQSDISVYFVNSKYEMIYTSTGDNSHTVAVENAIKNTQNGSLLYTNTVPVVSVYHWIPNLNAVLVAEVPQSRIYISLQSIIVTNSIIALVSAAIAVVGALYTIRTLSIPLANLEKAARQVAEGNLGAVTTIEQEDEIGTVAKTFNEMTNQLRTSVTKLEEMVSERTRDIELRSAELRTAAQIARDASLAQNTEELLAHTTRLIRERFGFYHVGIFLIDDNREFAVLRAAGGEAGQLMLANKHKLKIGEVGIVGFVAETGDARIALDVGSDAIHFRNPLLPYTRSEMALPLKVRGQVIGVLDVQSDKVNAFDQDDITIMQILTDQLSVAIERTRLLQELERNAAEMERSLQEYTSRGWRTLLQQGRRNQGYRYEGVAMEPVTSLNSDDIDTAISDTSMIIKGENNKVGSVLAVPIRLRGQTLGTLKLKFQGNEVPNESIKIVEEAASRLALALENARLVLDAQRLARRERQINLVTAQVQQSADLETVLQNTIRELGNALDVPRAFIQIGIVPEKDTDHNSG